MNKELIIILIIILLLIRRPIKEHWFGSSWYHSAAHAVTHVADDVAHTTTDVADAVEHTAVDVGSAVEDETRKGIVDAEKWGPRLLTAAFGAVTNPKQLIAVLLKQIKCKEIILHINIKYIILHMKSVKELRHYLHNTVSDYIWDKTPSEVKELVYLKRELDDYIEELIVKLVTEKILMLLRGVDGERARYILATNLCHIIKGEKLELPPLNLSQCPSEFPHKTHVTGYGNNGLCYNNEKFAAQGWGAPHSWCAFKQIAKSPIKREIKRGEGVYCYSTGDGNMKHVV